MNQTLSRDLDQLCINTARILSVDMSEKARFGHPGLPLGAAPMAYTLWDRILTQACEPSVGQSRPFHPLRWPWM